MKLIFMIFALNLIGTKLLYGTSSPQHNSNNFSVYFCEYREYRRNQNSNHVSEQPALIKVHTPAQYHLCAKLFQLPTIPHNSLSIVCYIK